MRLTTYFGPAFAVLMAFAGCGGTVAPICQPECPRGFLCTESGCVADGAGGLDLSVGGDLAATCSPACGGSAPYCRPESRTCVPCLEDANCPPGNVCRVLGNTTACVPGCKDDARCDGGKKCCGGACIDTGSDAANCGACGTACRGDNGRALCQGGQCVLSSCNKGWGDCNKDPADGCETNLSADPANCNACGAACDVKNGIAGCANGCYIRACQFGWDNCDGNDANGCETQVLTNQQNCGACGQPCANVPHAKNSCINAACQLISCDNGWSDCDKNLANGCEVATGNDVTNCGVCGNRCAQGLVCSMGQCTCPPCNLANAKSACVNLKCAISQCNVNWGDCDGLPQNGCEQNLTSDVRNCGACGMACALGLVCVNGSCTCPNCQRPNARTSCVNNVCQLDACFQGFGNCNGNDADGCEVDFATDRNHCGGCGMACPMGNTCINGMCQAFRSNLLLCGTSTRAINVFIPQGMNFNVMSSCKPDVNTQAMMISRSWNNGINAVDLQNYLTNGGIVLTEFNISHTVWNAAFNTNAAQGVRNGGCLDTLPSVQQFSANDPFWQANQFVQQQQGQTGCGYSVTNYPGITPLAGWDANNVAVGYRDLGSGRLWATDFDWQDQDTPNNNYGYTIGLVGYMITHRR